MARTYCGTSSLSYCCCPKKKLQQKMAFSQIHPLPHSFSFPSFNTNTTKPTIHFCRFSSQNQHPHNLESHKLVIVVKEKLEKNHHSLPVGKNGRDDEDMILWFLKDRKFDTDEAITKLSKAIKWREEFGVSELTEESVERIARTGKAYVHDFLDVNGRPVLVVVASKHFPVKEDQIENEKLCVFLIEKALSKLPDGKEDILGIFDFRGFATENSDFEFLKFLFDVFYYYYPKRLGQVLFVDTPFLFYPLWQLIKPLLKSYASLVRFCSADAVRKEYFTDTTVPIDFRK